MDAYPGASDLQKKIVPGHHPQGITTPVRVLFDKRR
jgi:hypothetical protein